MDFDSDWILVKGVLVFCYYSLRVEDGGKGKKKTMVLQRIFSYFFT